MATDATETRLKCLVVAPPGSSEDVRAVMDALDAWRTQSGFGQVQVITFEELPLNASSSLRDLLDAHVDLGLALFGQSAGAHGGGRATEVVDTLHRLGKQVFLLRSTETFTDSDAGHLDTARMATLQDWIERHRERGLPVHDYHHRTELMDLAVLAAEERLVSLMEDRPTGPTRQEVRKPRAPEPTIRRRPRTAHPTDVAPSPVAVPALTPPPPQLAVRPRPRGWLLAFMGAFAFLMLVTLVGVWASLAV